MPQIKIDFSAENKFKQVFDPIMLRVSDLAFGSKLTDLKKTQIEILFLAPKNIVARELSGAECNLKSFNCFAKVFPGESQ